MRCLIAVMLTVLAAPVAAIPITLFNSGVDGSGTVLAGGSLDPHFSVLENTSAAAVVVSNPAGTWLANDAASK